MANTPIKIYLDQLHWIGLAQARLGHPKGSQYASIWPQLIRLAADKKAIFPLSSTHYMELQGNTNYRQRKDVAETMALLSSFNTISGIGPLRRAELDHALFKRFGHPTEPRDIKPFGWGYKFAFGGRSQRMTLEGDPESIAAIKFRMGGDKKYNEWLMANNALFELAILSGSSDEEAVELRKKYDYKPEKAIEFGQMRVERERELAKNLLGDKAKGLKLKDIIAARTIYWEMGDLIEEAFNKPDMELTQDRIIKLGGKDWFMELIDDLPSVAGILALTEANHKTTSRAWTKNDVHDIDALTVAVPYCDIVVTEKHAATHMKKAGLESRFNTIIIRKLEDLPDAFSKILVTPRQA